MENPPAAATATARAAVATVTPPAHAATAEATANAVSSVAASPSATAKGLPHEPARVAAACGSGSDRTVPLTRWPGERFVYYFVYFQLAAPQFPSSLLLFTVRRRSVAINASDQT